MTIQDIVADIHQRNCLRRSAGLPALVKSTEIDRLLTAERSRAFEEAFARRWQDVVKAWSDKNESWLSRAARWSSAKAKFRAELDLDERKDAKGA